MEKAESRAEEDEVAPAAASMNILSDVVAVSLPAKSVVVAVVVLLLIV